MKTSDDWWKRFQSSEQVLSELAVKLKPGLQFVSIATVLTDVGHSRNSLIAVSIVVNLLAEAVSQNIQSDTDGLRTVLDLVQNRRLVEK